MHVEGFKANRRNLVVLKMKSKYLQRGLHRHLNDEIACVCIGIDSSIFDTVSMNAISFAPLVGNSVRMKRIELSNVNRVEKIVFLCVSVCSESSFQWPNPFFLTFK